MVDFPESPRNKSFYHLVKKVNDLIITIFRSMTILAIIVLLAVEAQDAAASPDAARRTVFA
jgi:hypothetical protein